LHIAATALRVRWLDTLHKLAQVTPSIMSSLHTSPHSPKQNHLLDALPAAEFARLSPHLERVSMPLGEVLHESGQPLPHAYFPTSAVVSLHYVLENGASSEVAGIGNEGMLGIALFMGGETTLSRAIVSIAGHGYRLRARLLLEEFNRSAATMHLLLRYTQALITQTSQTVACNRHHMVLQQFCRWLLLTLDRLPSNDLVMTQELIAGMLGVRREGVTEAAGKLKSLGAIDYRRGHITVLNRALLNAHVCECYAVVKAETDRLLYDVQQRRQADKVNK
jgi:CRP-like cAMP-binding protein